MRRLFASTLVGLGAALSFGLGLGCGSSPASDADGETGAECPVGSEACPCTVDGGCDVGLTCEAELCVDPSGGDGDGDPSGDGDPTGDGDGDPSGDGDGDPSGDGDGDGDPSPFCGDGAVDPGEECDTGGESATCNADCTESFCGDAKLNVSAGEECDDANNDSFDGCVFDCKRAITVSAGGFHTCALQGSGEVTCWGDNSFGQLDVPDDVSFLAIAAGYYHTCGVDTDGGVRCWGRNADGESTAPNGEFVAVGAGGGVDGTVRGVSCAIAAGGEAVCWGSNQYGQADEPQGSYGAIVVGDRFSCALSGDGDISCWGSLGVNPPGGQWLEIDAGAGFFCARDINEAAYCMGIEDGRLGPPPAGVQRSVTTGYVHGCVLSHEGVASCWGNNAWSGSQAPDGPPLISISAGGGSGPAPVFNDDHTCGVTVENEVVCWGDNTLGQLDVPEL